VNNTVLYVEDNEDNIVLVQRILKLRPHISLLIATTGERGLQMARDWRPGLILLDRRLPDIRGEEVIGQLKASAITATIPVVVLSGDSAIAELVIELGADEFLPKPFDLKELLKTVDRFCGPSESPSQ
jgi:CheY-like chemotaxis protein